MPMLHWIIEKITPKTKTAKLRAMSFLAIFCFSFLLFTLNVNAQPLSISDPNSNLQQGVDIVEQSINLPSTDIRVIIARIIRVALSLIGIVLVVLMMYAGFLWMTAGGNEDQITKAKAIIKNAVIGLAIILSAYAIVSFILTMLLGDSGGTPNPNGRGPYTTNLAGSGALGIVIRDHYPMRFQKDVARNTKIIITFAKPVKPESFIIDKTGEGNYGEICTALNRQEDCDILKLEDQFINIYRVDEEGNEDPITGANVTVSSSTVNNIAGVYTVVISPFEVLGDPQEEFDYEVHIGNGIKRDDPLNNDPQLFENAIEGYYEWRFTCSTELDETPPHVVAVIPMGDGQPKNSVIQVHFSEAVLPIGLQGALTKEGDKDFSAVPGGNVIIKNEDSIDIKASADLFSGYQILEITPTTNCGINSCGNPIFCLPVCVDGDTDCEKNEDSPQAYNVLLRSAQTTGDQDFPFAGVFASGIMDVAGNALDSNEDGIVNDSWFETASFSNFDNLNTGADNYRWDFGLRNFKETEPVFLNNITPDINGENVEAFDAFNLTFSKNLRASTLFDGVKIEEKPGPNAGEPSIAISPALFFRDTTRVHVYHDPFLEDISYFYYPVISSVIEDVYFNCFYPGKGPVNSGTLLEGNSTDCEFDDVTTCTAVTTGTPNDLSCNGVVAGEINLGSEANPVYPSTTSTCVNYLKQESNILPVVN